MSEFAVKTPDNVKEVLEYVFTFNAGMELSFIVDEKAGDTVADNGAAIKITLAPKPVMWNPEEFIPGEEIEIIKSTLAVKQVRKRTQRMPTPDELFDMQKTLHKEVTTIQ